MVLLTTMKNIEYIVNHLKQIKPHIIVMGCSSGGLDAIEKILKDLPSSFPVPIIICQHLAPDSGEYLVQYLMKQTQMPIFEARPDTKICNGHIYVAPGGYHLLIETHHTLSLDVSEKVSYCRPSIDVLFESALSVYKNHILAILLSGANEDGCMGAKHIFNENGLVIVQDPLTAKSAVLPQAIINRQINHYTLAPQKINQLLLRWSHEY